MMTTLIHEVTEIHIWHEDKGFCMSMCDLSLFVESPTIPELIDLAGDALKSNLAARLKEFARGPAPRPVLPGVTMADIERQAILQAFEINGKDERKTADQLGIGIRTLRKKLRQYGLEANP